LLDDMLETVRAAPGVGLAAPQVGIPQRIAVIEYPADDEDPESPMQLFEIINPEIIKMKGGEEGQEGCLSMPGLSADVTPVALPTLRHRLILRPEAEIEGLDADAVIKRILAGVEVPR
ncbi:MAG: peptide deformylase, partial [Caldilineaceae bacterium]